MTENAGFTHSALLAFEDSRMGAVTLSAKAIDCLKRILKGEVVTKETSEVSKGECRAFDGVLARG
jgi:thymidylate synthase (FAD)